MFAVLRRIKVTFIDTIVRIEHQPLDLETGIALEVHIKRWVVVTFLYMKLFIKNELILLW